MSKRKKHKKKFKAQLHQAMQEIQRNKTSIQEQGNIETKKLAKPQNDSVSQKRQENKIEPEKLSEIAPTKVGEGVKSDEYNYVKKDVLKIITIVAICIVLLVGIWILSLKTNYISNFANTLANFSHLSQGE